MTEREDTIERIERVLKLTHKKSITVTIPRLTAERAVSLLKEKEPLCNSEITEEVQIHGAMVYGCKDCMSRWIMYLEKGLEEPGCDDRKPVPFGIMCPFCGGFHAYDISGYIRIPGNGYQALPKNASYFANLPDRDCGVSRISGMMDSLDEHEIPSVKIVRETKVVK